MIGKLALDDAYDILDVCAALCRGDRRRFHVARQLLAVVRIEAPLSACGRTVIVDEYAEALTLLFVEVGHQETLLAIGKLREALA